MKPFRSLSVIVLSIVLFAACAPAAPTAAPTKPPAPAAGATAPAQATAAPSPTPAAKIKRGGVLRVGFQNDWELFDAVLCQRTPNPDDLIYEALLNYVYNPQAGRFELKPSLAESWQVVDSKTIVFKIRSGVKFHDGTNFDAQVAKWNIERLMTHPKSMGKIEIGPVASVDAPDATTLRVNLKAPAASILTNMSDDGKRALMHSRSLVEKSGADFGTAPDKIAGTGPMKLTEWLRGDHVTEVKFDGYWDKGEDGNPLPYLDGVRERFIADDSIRALEMKSGNMDVTEQVAGKDVPGIKADPNLLYLEKPWQGNFYTITFNAKSGPFSGNLKLRQAALYAIDRDSVAKTLGLGVGEAWFSLWAPGQIGTDPSVPKYNTYDQAKAKQFLAEAGYPNGFDATLSTISRELDVRQAQMLKQMFDAIGLRTTIDAQERIAWVQRTTAGDYQFGTYRTNFILDPDLNGTHLSTGGSSNYALWSNKEFDKCMDDGRATYDDKERHEIYKRCQVILYNDAYFGGIWKQAANDVISNRVHGFQHRYQNAFRLKEAWLE